VINTKMRTRNKDRVYTKQQEEDRLVIQTTSKLLIVRTWLVKVYYIYQ